MWGDDGSGYSCTSIFDQGTSFEVSFKWTGDASTVKAFPYLKADPSSLPTQMWNVSTLLVSGEWSMIVDGTADQSGTDQAVAMDDIALKANVAIDMFLSDNATNSTEVGPPIEVMIWLWHVPAILPLGWDTSTPQIDTVEVDGTNFSLYNGWNAQGQHVFSWLSDHNMTRTDADYSPLLRYLWEKGQLSGALYLGQVEFGTEVMHAGLPTTFSASNYTLMIYREGDKDDPDPKTTSTTSSSTSSSSTRSTSTSTQSATPTDLSASATSHASSASSVSPPGLSLWQMCCLGLPTFAAAGSMLWVWMSVMI